MLARAVLFLVLALLPGIASAADPYQWVGATSIAVTGDGNGLGYVGMTTQCRADFGPGARMCKSEEVMDSDTLNPNAIPAAGCWIRPSWRLGDVGSALDESGATGSPLTMTCKRWTSANPMLYGLVLFPNGGFSSDADPDGPTKCSISRPVACCKPTPVPAPSASLSIPIGAGALVWLSMLKGSA